MARDPEPTASCSSTEATGLSQLPQLSLLPPHTQLNPHLCKRYRLLEGLAEHQDLHLIVDGEHTSTGNTTEDVGTGTLEERLEALLGDDLATSIEGRLVLDGLTRSHHHTTTDGVQRVRGDTGASGDGPSESEGGKEVTLKRTNQDDGLQGIVHSEVQTTVDDDTGDGGTETTVETGDSVRGEGLLVDIDQAVELTVTTGLGVLVVVGQTGTGVIQGVDEQEGSGTSGLGTISFGRFEELGRKTYTTGGKVTSHPLGVSITLLLEGEHGLVGITESEVQGLGREVTDDVGSVTTPQRGDTLLGGGSAEALDDTIVFPVKTTRLQHLILRKKLDPAEVRSRISVRTYLVLDQELDTLDGSSSGLGDSGGNTTHCDQVSHHAPSREWTLKICRH